MHSKLIFPDSAALKSFLDKKVDQYMQPDFIPNDPILIPHLFSKQQDIEIMGFWAAMLAWGQRVTIINKCKELIDLMDGVPHQFITQHEEKDLKRFLHFKHRTFNATDTLYFIAFFKHHFALHDSMEKAFFPETRSDEVSNKVEAALSHFKSYFFSLPDYPHRTQKHVSSPINKSTCKRLNMFLRWMVRKDDAGVDFGLWNRISPADLFCPLDVHVDRQARNFGLITRKQTDWQTTRELTENLRLLDPHDPVKYDFALFGIGVEENNTKNGSFHRIL